MSKKAKSKSKPKCKISEFNGYTAISDLVKNQTAVSCANRGTILETAGTVKYILESRGTIWCAIQDKMISKLFILESSEYSDEEIGLWNSKMKELIDDSIKFDATRFKVIVSLVKENLKVDVKRFRKFKQGIRLILEDASSVMAIRERSICDRPFKYRNATYIDIYQEG